MTTTESAPYGAPAPAKRATVSVLTVHDMKARREKIAMLTAYDATFAHAASNAGVDCLLVGDSLGMVCKGDDSTLSVTVDDIRYHARAVARGIAKAANRPLLVADMPFGSYQVSKEEAIRHAAQLMGEGAHMVKLEGGGWVCELAELLAGRGIPVCAHLGLTPQSVHSLGGYRVQGRTQEQADTLLADAKRLESAGATMLVLEMVPAALSARITQELRHCATIGIGAGSDTDGQVLVLHDMLGLALGRTPKFVADFLKKGGSIEAAMRGYVAAVKTGEFPVNAIHAW